MVEIIRALRRAVSQAMADALRPIIDDQPTEAQIRDAFHEQLSRIANTSAEGWYAPPPKGLIVTVGDPPDFERLDRPSFRPPETWPSGAISLSRDSVLYAYGSRVDVESGMLGDIAFSLYRGKDSRVASHLHDVWDITMKIAASARVGTSFGELFCTADALIETAGFKNNVLSVSDPSSTNIGHTVPWSWERITNQESDVLRHGTPQQVAALVNSKRRFVSRAETLKIAEGMAFTIEPRLHQPGLPMANFHVVVCIENERPVIVAEFEPVFDLFGMTDFVV